MKLLSKSNKYQYTSQKNLPSSQYIHFRENPREFVRKIVQKYPKNKNPLYCQQSLSKYFCRKSPSKFKQLTHEFITKKQSSEQYNQNIRRFRKLQELLRKQNQQYGKKHVHKQIQKLENYIDDQLQHYENLNWDDGIYPLTNQFQMINSKVKKYVEQLLDEKPRSKFINYQKKRIHKSKIHTQNILDYIQKEEYESRYRKLPKKASQRQQKKQIVSIQRTNRGLRSKTLYCKQNFSSVSLKKGNVNKEIKQECKHYMSQQLKKINRTLSLS